jgi:hypothetical protein
VTHGEDESEVNQRGQQRSKSFAFDVYSRQSNEHQHVQNERHKRQSRRTSASERSANVESAGNDVQHYEGSVQEKHAPDWVHVAKFIAQVPATAKSAFAQLTKTGVGVEKVTEISR